MIRLDLTTRKLEVVLGGAITTNQLQVTVSFITINKDGISWKGQTTLNLTSSTTAVTICAAPAEAGFVKEIDYISVYNADTVSATVTINIDESATDYLQVKQALRTTESLIYSKDRGWRVL